MFWKKLLGIFGEDIASDFLKKQGFKILKRNYRCKFGEIDIIAKEKDVISFVEVKTVATNKTETPFDTIDLRKRKHIQQTASFYLNKEKKQNLTCRFDVISIRYKEDKEPEIELIRDAF
jgi:putative endonuclease